LEEGLFGHTIRSYEAIKAQYPLCAELPEDATNFLNNSDGGMLSLLVGLRDFADWSREGLTGEQVLLQREFANWVADGIQSLGRFDTLLSLSLNILDGPTIAVEKTLAFSGMNESWAHGVATVGTMVFPAGVVKGVGQAVVQRAIRGVAQGFVGGGRTALYRAVSHAEYADIAASGVLRAGPNSYATGKFFAEAGEHAAKWGRALEGAGNFRVIEAQFPTSIANQFMRWQHLDNIGPARFGTFGQIGQPTIQLWPGSP
jgi:hypothetical protein